MFKPIRRNGGNLVMLKDIKEIYIILLKEIFSINFLLFVIVLYFISHIAISFSQTYFNF